MPAVCAARRILNPTAARSKVIGGMTMGVAQSDWQFHAYNGSSDYEGDAFTDLRAVFAVHPEPFTVVARADSGVETFTDLAGKRVSLDEPGSGTLVDAKIILEAFGLSESDITPEYLKPDQAADRMRDGAMARTAQGRDLAARKARALRGATAGLASGSAAGANVGAIQRR